MYMMTVYVIYQTRETVFHRDQEPQRSIFEEIGRLWIADETLSQVFDIVYSQSRNKNKGVNGEVKSSS